ncbi:MAG TPA: hypothetical protein VE135_15500 [Pyrinomonadaceae bacterium]|nr:hypothetical protein [Pyrinomonadaceae bacterium]
MTNASEARPISVGAMSIFFWAGAVISLIAALSLLFPGSVLEPMWKLNPRAREGFAEIGGWAILLMGAVSIACAMAAAGLWRGSRWGYLLALVLLAINLIGDIANVLLGTEPRAAVGIPIVIAILVFLLASRREISLANGRA